MKNALALCLAVALLPITSVSADPIPERIYFQVGQQPGGTGDSIARVIAKNLGQFLAGNPEITVQNVPGAGGVNMLRRLRESSNFDGSVIAMSSFSHLISNRIDPSRGIDPDFRWIAALTSEPSTCVLSDALEIESFSEVGDRQLNMASTSPSASNYIDAAIVKNVLGIDLDIITGFRGGGEVVLAIERGEVDGGCGMPLYSFLKSPFAENKSFLGYWGLEPVAEYRDAAGPALIELIEDPADREAVEFLTNIKSMRYVLWLHPDTQESIVATYSDAMQSMMSDPDFLDEISRILPVLDPRSGPEVEAYIAKIENIDQAIIERAREIIK